jgi:hypothetical protein
MSNIKILVCIHKKDYFVEDDPFMPIQVGKAVSGMDLGIQGDDTGDNISRKNENYCELTAMYWAWKNLKNVDYIGLNHYRRYFHFKKFHIRDKKIVSLNEFLSYHYQLSVDVDSLLKKKDIILPRLIVYPYNMILRYAAYHTSDDIHTLEQTIHEVSPEYDAAFQKVMVYNNKMSFYNMFICRWEIFDDYCSWLFKIIPELERKINTDHYNPVQKRIYGYMGEYLLNIYIEKHKLRKCFFPIYWINDEEKNESFIHYIFNKIRYSIVFSIIKPSRKINSKK